MDITRLFKDWHANYFCPTEFRLYEENDFDKQDNSSGHLQNFSEERKPLDVKIDYMSLNSETLLRSLESGNYYYTLSNFMEMVRVLNSTEKNTTALYY